MSANEAQSPKHDTLTLHRVKRFDAVGDVARNAEGTYLVTLLDFETTGLDSDVDVPIEIGLTKERDKPRRSGRGRIAPRSLANAPNNWL